jgi:hypothetical protein
MGHTARAGLVTATFAGLILYAGAASADVVVVVSTKSPVDTLSRSQVVDLFLGKSSRFPGGRSAVPIDQAEGSAKRVLPGVRRQVASAG